MSDPLRPCSFDLLLHDWLLDTAFLRVLHDGGQLVSQFVLLVGLEHGIVVQIWFVPAEDRRDVAMVSAAVTALTPRRLLHAVPLFTQLDALCILLCVLGWGATNGNIPVLSSWTDQLRVNFCMLHLFKLLSLLHSLNALVQVLLNVDVVFYSMFTLFQAWDGGWYLGWSLEQLLP